MNIECVDSVSCCHHSLMNVIGSLFIITLKDNHSRVGSPSSLTLVGVPCSKHRVPGASETQAAFLDLEGVSPKEQKIF